MIHELRNAQGAWGNWLPDATDYDEPRWSTSLQQEQTPYGQDWVDGSGRPRQGQVTLRVYVSGRTPAECDAESQRVMALLLTASAYRDVRRSTDYLLTQGVLGEPQAKNYRGCTTRLLTVTLALADPYWHVTDADGSAALFPVSAPGTWTPDQGLPPGQNVGAQEWRKMEWA
ncbi:hypothetical protein [Deinococcus enclensis]|uniref:Uncharacterized protein n=1 Tax=Deinococcus enclensis TaxID=1049582 RepID=A0ABT9MB66_9DEIO|nr:hypothetical protein [Deinococcus enclensis]MDP9763835.1 hypothetical protein [Deinococcus enclensis]